MKAPRMVGLDRFRLSATKLHRLGNRRVRLSVQLVGRTTRSLLSLQPAERQAQIRNALRTQERRLRSRFVGLDFIPRNKREPSWTLDVVLPARLVRDVATAAEVNYVDVQSVEGVRPLQRRQPGWFCVWGIVAIQVEGQRGGMMTLEDRLVLVKALDSARAERSLKRYWRQNAEPYLNPHGELVRWQLVSVRDVYDIGEDTLDPNGTEVYSRLRRVRLRLGTSAQSKRRARVVGS